MPSTEGLDNDFQKRKCSVNKNIPCIERVKTKISQSESGQHHSPATEFKKGHKAIGGFETRFTKGMVSYNRGKKLGPITEERRKKLSDAHKGKALSEEHKKNIGNAMKTKWSTPEYRLKIRTSMNRMQQTRTPKTIKIKLRIKKTRRPLSQEERQRISENWKRLYREGIIKPRNGMLGKHHSEETKRKLSEINSGEKSILWRGGISFEPYGLEFNKQLRKHIRHRDQFSCQQCFRHENEIFVKNKYGKTVSQKLHVHHIDFNKKNNSQNNLISLCRNCHAQTQYNREQWISYFQNKVKVL